MKLIALFALVAVSVPVNLLYAGDACNLQASKSATGFAQQTALQTPKTFGQMAAEQLSWGRGEAAPVIPSDATIDRNNALIRPATFGQMAAEQLSWGRGEAAPVIPSDATIDRNNALIRPVTFGQMAAEQLSWGRGEAAPATHGKKNARAKQASVLVGAFHE